MKISVDYLILYTATYSVIIPFVACFLARKKKSMVLNTLWILLGMDFLIALIIEYYSQLGLDTSVYFNIYPLLEFSMISIFYTYQIPHCKKWIHTLIPFYVVFFVSNSLWIENIRTIQNYPTVVESVVILTYSGLHYRHIRNTIEKDPPFYQDGRFWITTGFALYFFFSIGLFILANKILTQLEPATARMIWCFHAFNYIAKTVLLTVGIRQIHQEESKEFPYEKFGVPKNWQQQMSPNPNLDKSKGDITKL